MIQKNKKKRLLLRKKNLAVLLIIFCTFFTAAGQFFQKIGVRDAVFDIRSLVLNFNLILGISFYGLGFILLFLALKYGELSRVYPLISLSLIWVALLSRTFLSESVSTINWIGIIVIVSGVAILTKDVRK